MSISIDALKETKTWQRLGPISNGGTVFGLAISPVAEVPLLGGYCCVSFSRMMGEKPGSRLQGLTTRS
jgi:hypothetical protein